MKLWNPFKQKKQATKTTYDVVAKCFYCGWANNRLLYKDKYPNPYDIEKCPRCGLHTISVQYIPKREIIKQGATSDKQES
jgi:uncharacterized protein (DUF2225 family)